MGRSLLPERTVARNRSLAKQRASQRLIEQHRDEHAVYLHEEFHGLGVPHIHAAEDHEHGVAS